MNGCYIDKRRAARCDMPPSQDPPCHKSILQDPWHRIWQTRDSQRLKPESRTPLPGLLNAARARHLEVRNRAVLPSIAAATPLPLVVCGVVAEYVQPDREEFAKNVFTGGDDAVVFDAYGKWSIIYKGPTGAVRYDNFYSTKWHIGVSCELDDLYATDNLVKRLPDIDIGYDLRMVGLRRWDLQLAFLFSESVRLFAARPLRYV